MVGEQTAVQREWSEHWIALKSVEAELRQKEEIIPMEEEKLRVLQERLRTGHIWSCYVAAICQPHDVICFIPVNVMNVLMRLSFEFLCTVQIDPNGSQ